MKPSFLLFLLLFSSSVAAQTAAPIAAPVTEQIIVTASALPEEVDETPAAATVVTRADIEAREARDLSEVLREVPGLTVSRTGTQGHSTTLFIRGGSSKQALVLWNGIEINNPYFSGYNFGQLSSAGVERVEVVRGPFSALYGSEAVSGVVNVLTRPDTSGATIDLEAGERGLLNAVFAGAFRNESWNAHGSLERRQDEGFLANDDYTSNAITGGAELNPRTGLSIGLLGRWMTYDVGIPRVPNASATAFVPSPHRREDGSELQLLVPVRLEAGRFVADLRLSESRRDDDFADPQGPFGPEAATTDSRSRAARASVRTNTVIGTITVGGEYEQAKVDHVSNFSHIDERDRDNNSLFIEDRYSLALGTNSSFELAAGLRHDNFDTFGSEVSPRLAAAYVRGGHKLRAGYGEGFRAPAIGELYSPFFGNADLQPESSRSIEAGYEYFSAATTASFTLFESDYDDLIVFATDGVFRNIAAATSRGIEVGASHRVGGLTLGATYTFIDTEDEATGDELLRRPRHAGSIALGYALSRFTTQLVVTHQGERADVTDLAPFGVVANDAYTIADVTLHYHHGALAPYVKLENVTDEQYEEVFGYPSSGRRALVGIRYRMQ